MSRPSMTTFFASPWRAVCRPWRGARRGWRRPRGGVRDCGRADLFGDVLAVEDDAAGPSRFRREGELLHAMDVGGIDVLRSAQSASARYMAPVSMYVKPRRCARRAMVLLPAPAGPSIATTIRLWLPSNKKDSRVTNGIGFACCAGHRATIGLDEGDRRGLRLRLWQRRHWPRAAGVRKTLARRLRLTKSSARTPLAAEAITGTGRGTR